MKYNLLLLILLILSLLSCNKHHSGECSSSGKEVNQNTFDNCFSDVDTSKGNECLGCSNMIFKHISNKYVLNIIPDLPIQFDSCIIIKVDSTNGKQLTRLMVFDNNNASLTNICTDLYISNFPEPSRYLYATSGEIIIGFSDSTEYYGNKTFHTTVLIKHLLFVDPKTKEKTEIENELFWKVLDTGTPG